MPFYVGGGAARLRGRLPVGGTPWVTGKALAISSPALLAAPRSPAPAMLCVRPRGRSGGARDRGARRRRAVVERARPTTTCTLAPRARLAELQHIGKLVAGKGPTFVNEYEVYADRHFLREGAPVEPAEYRNGRPAAATTARC